MIEFRVNKEKTIIALLFLISQANERGKRPSQYDLVKATFLADRAHLNKYGRPITFDRYVAMVHGPVPSFAYDCLKPDFNWRFVGRAAAPWTWETDGKANRFHLNGERPDLRKLSASDQQCLADAMATILSLTFRQIRRLTHEDRAYVESWRDDGIVNAFPIDMSLLLDEADDETLDDLRHLAEITAA